MNWILLNAQLIGFIFAGLAILALFGIVLFSLLKANSLCKTREEIDEDDREQIEYFRNRKK